jgi:hypothetical protein
MGTGYCYAVTNGKERIKIGWSASPERRVSELQTGSPDRLILFGFTPGTRQDEARLHASLWRYRTKGEWFKDNKEVRNSLLWLRVGLLTHRIHTTVSKFKFLSVSSLEASRFFVCASCALDEEKKAVAIMVPLLGKEVEPGVAVGTQCSHCWDDNAWPHEYSRFWDKWYEPVYRGQGSVYA